MSHVTEKDLLRPTDVDGSPCWLTFRMRSLKWMLLASAWKRVRKRIEGGGSSDGVVKRGCGQITHLLSLQLESAGKI